MIAVRELVAFAGSFRLGPVELQLGAGEFLVLLGPSGAGKTLLLESLVGLAPIESGAVVLDGKDVTALAPERREVAYMPQDVALFPHLSVRDNVLFGRRARGTMQGAASELEHIAQKLGIGELLARPRVQTLSGGERQRVALARSLITNPRVLFLDESFSALDAHVRRQLLLEVRELQSALGLTVVYVTHSQQEALVVGDRVVVLMQGRVAQAGAPQDVLGRPTTLSVARFFQIENLLPIESVEGDTCRVGGLTLRLDSGQPPGASARWLAIAAADVVLLGTAEAQALGLTDNMFPARVSSTKDARSRRVVRLALHDGGEQELVCELGARDRLLDARRLSEGDDVVVYLNPKVVAVL